MLYIIEETIKMKKCLWHFAIIISKTLTYCRFSQCFYTAFSVLTRLLSIFSLHSTTKSKIHQSLSIRNPFFEDPFIWACQICPSTVCHFVQKKRCKGSRGITTHRVKKQIWTLLNDIRSKVADKTVQSCIKPSKRERYTLCLQGPIRARLQSHSQKQLTNSVPKVRLCQKWPSIFVARKK